MMHLKNRDIFPSPPALVRVRAKCLLPLAMVRDAMAAKGSHLCADFMSWQASLQVVFHRCGVLFGGETNPSEKVKW